MKQRLVFGLFLGSLLLGGLAGAANDAKLAKATFAGGCFWCMEEALDKVEGVISTTSGYTGGRKANPTYEEVSAGGTGHTEAVEILYDPTRVTYAQILDTFWRNIDPTTPNAQFCDHGSQYRSAIFHHDETQKRLAEDSKKALDPLRAEFIKLEKCGNEFLVSVSVFARKLCHRQAI